MKKLEHRRLRVTKPRRSRSGTSSASRGIRCARRSREMGPLLFSRLLNLNDTQSGVLSLVFKIADDHQLLLLDLKDLQAMLQYVGDQAKALADRVRQHLGRQRGRDPARAGDAGTGRRRQVLRRAGAEHRRPDADRRQRARRGQHPRGRQADPVAAGLCHVPAVAADRAVREAAGSRRPGQAEAGVLLRRGAPAVRRSAAGRRRQGDADRAPDPLEGRGRLLRHAESARHSGRRARAAWQSRATRVARVHSARTRRQ